MIIYIKYYWLVLTLYDALFAEGAAMEITKSFSDLHICLKSEIFLLGQTVLQTQEE